jgi:hypothetical protein
MRTTTILLPLLFQPTTTMPSSLYSTISTNNSPSFPLPWIPTIIVNRRSRPIGILLPCWRFCNKPRPPIAAVAASRWCIYDPYYCDGAVIRNLNELGFTNVYNRKEDCYAVWEQQNAAATLSSNSPNSHLPPFDVLVTNPPYSDNHIERLIQFISSNVFGARPWFLLLPNWVHKKDYFVQASKSTTTAHGRAAALQPFFIVPPSHRRYVYVPPPHFRSARKSDVHVKSSPFVSMWYCWGGTAHMNSRLMQYFYESKQHAHSKSQSSSASASAGASWTECDLARSKSALRDLRRKQR